MVDALPLWCVAGVCVATMSGAKAALTPTIVFRCSTRNTVYEVLKSRPGWVETHDDVDWDLCWADVGWVRDMYDQIQMDDDQRLNHFPNHYELTRKDLMVKNLKRMRKQLERNDCRAEATSYCFWTGTFVLPSEYGMFVEEFKRSPGAVWIMKPIGKAQGRGIFLFNKLSQISDWKKDHRWKADQPQAEAYIAQRYVENPYLIGGKKFDLRLYVLVTSFNPLTKKADDYDKEVGCKWDLQSLKMFMTLKHGARAVDELFYGIQCLITRSLLSVQKTIIHDKHCFELYGYDVLVDADLKPWLIEVNASPSLSAENAADRNLKTQLISDALDVVDLEGRLAGDEQRVGSFRLIWANGPTDTRAPGGYSTFLGTEKPSAAIDYAELPAGKDNWEGAAARGKGGGGLADRGNEEGTSNTRGGR
eukprot:g1604.t1